MTDNTNPVRGSNDSYQKPVPDKNHSSSSKGSGIFATIKKWFNRSPIPISPNLSKHVAEVAPRHSNSSKTTIIGKAMLHSSSSTAARSTHPSSSTAARSISLLHILSESSKKNVGFHTEEIVKLNQDLNTDTNVKKFFQDLSISHLDKILTRFNKILILPVGLKEKFVAREAKMLLEEYQKNGLSFVLNKNSKECNSMKEKLNIFKSTNKEVLDKLPSIKLDIEMAINVLDNMFKK